MRIGETIATYDVGLALRGKSGKFEITSPAGERYDVTCKPHHSISYLEWSSNGTDNPPFLIKKVAEGTLVADTKATATVAPSEEGRVASPPAPLMLEPAADERPSSTVGDLDLLYIEDNEKPGQPSACVYLKSGPRDHAAEGQPMVTTRCATFNELDSEIRRLQARLDEIRSRAKKLFYRTPAFEASA